MWFHLSKKKWKTDTITELRQTKMGHGEPALDRFSVSPTVGRAYLACPHATEGKPLFIYQVHVKTPERATCTADYETSQEHLITESVLASEDGRIPVSLVGQVLVESEIRVHLLIQYRNWKLEMTHEEEEHVLWNVSDGMWLFCNPSRDEATKKLAELRSGKHG